MNKQNKPRKDAARGNQLPRLSTYARSHIEEKKERERSSGAFPLLFPIGPEDQKLPDALQRDRLLHQLVTYSDQLFFYAARFYKAIARDEGTLRLWLEILLERIADQTIAETHARFVNSGLTVAERAIEIREGTMATANLWISRFQEHAKLNSPNEDLIVAIGGWSQAKANQISGTHHDISTEAHPNETPASKSARRRAVIEPWLAAKRPKAWSINHWAERAGVNFHTANRFLKGVTDLQKGKRKSLAEALGIDLKNFPA